MRRCRPWRRDHVVFCEGGGTERVKHCDECLSAAATTSMLDVDNEETCLHLEYFPRRLPPCRPSIHHPDLRPSNRRHNLRLLAPSSIIQNSKKSCTHSVTRWTNFTRRFEGQSALPVCSSTTQCFNNVYITPQCPPTATMYLHQLQVWACLLVRSKLRSPLIV